MSMRGFAKRIKQRANNVTVNADDLVRKCALAIDAAVVIATPVDTGRARSNWQVNLDGAVTGTIEAYEPGSGGFTGAANSRFAIEQGKEVAAQYNGDTNDSIHITNNLAYIGRLNDGHSAQAPAGFVETAILVGESAVMRAGGLTERSSRS